MMYFQYKLTNNINCLRISWWPLFFFLLLTASLSAQFDPSKVSSGGSRSTSPTSQQEEEIRSDAIRVKYLLPNDLEGITPFNDTSIGLHFQQYDPARDRLLEYGTLGNLGSAHQPLFFQPRHYQGFDDGFHQFDLYQVYADQLRYYEIDRAFSDLFFTQGPTQNDVYFKGRFSRNFANGINYSLEYNRMKNLGVYNNQQAKTM